MDLQNWARARSLARYQSGVVSRQQLLELGIPDRTLTRRVRCGDWVQADHGVLVCPGTPDCLATRSRIVALQVPDCILTGPSAAALVPHPIWDELQLGFDPWLIHAPRRRQARFLAHPGVRWRRVGPWVVASVADAVIDMIRFLPPNRSRSLAYRAVQLRVLTLAYLDQKLQRLARLSGVRQLRAARAELGLGIRSEGERMLVKHLKSAELVGWIANYRVTVGARHYELDVVFPDLRIALEVDGYAYHSSRDQFVQDKRRQNDLITAGWLVLRFSWRDLTEQPERVIADVRAGIVERRSTASR